MAIEMISVVKRSLAAEVLRRAKKMRRSIASEVDD